MNDEMKSESSGGGESFVVAFGVRTNRRMNEFMMFLKSGPSAEAAIGERSSHAYSVRTVVARSVVRLDVSFEVGRIGEASIAVGRGTDEGERSFGRVDLEEMRSK